MPRLSSTCSAKGTCRCLHPQCKTLCPQRLNQRQSRRLSPVTTCGRWRVRAARDRDSMLHVGESLLEEVTQLAGAERAETIRERMKQLLPREQPQDMALAAA